MGKKKMIDALHTRINAAENVLRLHRKELNQLHERTAEHDAALDVPDKHFIGTPAKIAHNLTMDKKISAVLNKADPNKPTERAMTNDTKCRMLSLMATRLDCEISVFEVRQFFEEIYELDADDVLDAMLYAQAMIMGEG